MIITFPFLFFMIASPFVVSYELDELFSSYLYQIYILTSILIVVSFKIFIMINFVFIRYNQAQD